ncbi:MAG: 3-ketoacyl-ACP reductase [Clostridiales bacterium]|nr:3-ketoacyl-ACP reductase [Clostridiales bacterium]
MSNKVALITGAGRGIGNGIAIKLAKDGFNIVIMDVLKEEDISDNIDLVKDEDVEVLYIKGDITSSDSRINVVNKIMDKFGRIDVLVNNAGVAPRNRMDILETTEESFDFVNNINLKGTFFLSQVIANKMISLIGKISDYKPTIVNISSMSAYTSSVSRGEYCISKAGVSMVTKLFADRLAEYGITVNEIRPGIIFTPMTEVVKDKYDKLIGEGLTPIKRWGYPEDIAKVVSSLCSGNFSFTTGEFINVDGGFHIQRL